MLRDKVAYLDKNFFVLSPSLHENSGLTS
jgi:hypothetical protein